MRLNIEQSVFWITRTAVMTALLVTVQFLTAMLGNQYVTGSMVNLLLAVSALTFGLATGLSVAVMSPVFAFLVGVGPVFPPLVPFIILGNAVYVVAWFVLGRLSSSMHQGSWRKAFSFINPVAAAAAKFLALYSGVVLLALPYILNVNEKQIELMSLMFSYPQFVTALIGGSIANAITPTLKKALRNR